MAYLLNFHSQNRKKESETTAEKRKTDFRNRGESRERSITIPVVRFSSLLLQLKDPDHANIIYLQNYQDHEKVIIYYHIYLRGIHCLGCPAAITAASTSGAQALTAASSFTTAPAQGTPLPPLSSPTTPACKEKTSSPSPL